MQNVLDTYSKEGLQIVGFTKLTRSSTEEEATISKDNGVSYSMGVEDGTLTITPMFQDSSICCSTRRNGDYGGHPARITDKMITTWLSH